MDSDKVIIKKLNKIIKKLNKIIEKIDDDDTKGVTVEDLRKVRLEVEENNPLRSGHIRDDSIIETIAILSRIDARKGSDYAKTYMDAMGYANNKSAVEASVRGFEYGQN